MSYEYTFTYDSERLAELLEREDCPRVRVTAQYIIYRNANGAECVGRQVILSAESPDLPSIDILGTRSEDDALAFELLKELESREAELIEHAYAKESAR
jgi:hypothetical protein